MPEGEIDSSFADNGLGTAQLATASYGSDIALTPAGNIVVSGYATESASDLHYFAARFLGAIDLFWIWWCVSLAIGIGVLFKRKTGGIAMTFLGIYLCIALVLAVVRSGN
jgi:hypothetical protein